jgi:hypothetical protein
VVSSCVEIEVVCVEVVDKKIACDGEVIVCKFCGFIGGANRAENECIIVYIWETVSLFIGGYYGYNEDVIGVAFGVHGVSEEVSKRSIYELEMVFTNPI